MKRLALAMVLLTGFAGFAGLALAAVPVNGSSTTAVVSPAADSPLALLKSIWSEMRAELEKNQGQLKQSHVIDDIVNRILVPHVDQYRMAAATVGRHYWRAATKAQRKAFVNEFRQLLISTYAAPLTSYDGDQVRFPRVVDSENRRTVEVKTVIERRTGQRIPVKYYLIRKKHDWKVYDFSIENASIVSNYRAQFSSVLGNGGMPALIKKLHSHNEKVN